MTNDVPLGLQLGNALELDPELVTLRARELLELIDARSSAVIASRRARGWRSGSDVVRAPFRQDSFETTAAPDGTTPGFSTMCLYSRKSSSAARPRRRPRPLCL